MTKKDYILIAEVMKKNQDSLKKKSDPVDLYNNMLVHTRICVELNIALKRDNPNFDGPKFLEACGI